MLVFFFIILCLPLIDLFQEFTSRGRPGRRGRRSWMKGGNPKEVAVL
jgi:hypothetical protein